MYNLLFSILIIMAITITNRGAATGATSSTTFTFSPISNFGTNTNDENAAFLSFCYDPAGVAGSDTFSSLADSHGNTWTLLELSTNILGAGSGVILRNYYSNLNVSNLSTATVFTITFSSAVTAKAWSLIEARTDIIGFNIIFGDSNNTTGTGTAPTITSSNVIVTDAIVGVLAGEGNTTVTADSDTTNGTWSAALADVKSGVGLTSVQIYSQYKVQITANSTQTFNPTFLTSLNYAILFFIIKEYKPQEDPYGNNGYYNV